MERKDYKRYSREFKLEAVRLAAVGDRPKAQIARELGIRVNQLRKWRLDFEEEERTGAPKRVPTSEEDLGRLRRENAKLKEENEILKNRPRGCPRPLWIETQQCLHCRARLDRGRLLFGGIRPRQKTWPRGSCGPSCGGTLRDPV